MTKNNENSEDNKDSDTSPTKTLSNLSTEQQSQQTFQYSREEMLTLREAKLSRIRPPELSRDFDSEKGLFSPDKWVQFQWQCEGVELRGRRRQNVIPVSGANAYPIGSNIKTLSSILESTIAATKNDDFIDNHYTMLSPQRRGFSSGCKAASPPKSAEKSHQQQQSSSSRSRWQIKNNGIDFKPAFQKNALEANSRSSRSGSSLNNTSGCGNNGGNNSTSWNNSGNSKHVDKSRRFGERERTRSSATDNDQVPEWVDAGPTSVFDVIELHGLPDDEEQSANEQKRKHSRGRKDSTGNNHLKASSETCAAPRSSSRQKRQSSEDVRSNKSQNNINNISRPSSSHKTPQQSDSFYSSHSPVRVIMASELESSILREHQEKLEKEKALILEGDCNKTSTFDLFAALGINPSKDLNYENDKTTSESKLPNSDAEFAACILGLPIGQISKIIPNMLPTVNNELLQQEQPTTSRLIRWQKATLNSAKSENNLSRIGDEELKMSMMMKRDLMAAAANDDLKMNKHLLASRAAHNQFVPNGQQPFVFNPALGGGGHYGGGGNNQFPGGGYGGHHFQNMGPSQGNFALPPYAVPFTPSHQQFYPPFGSSTGLNHPTYLNRQQSPCPMNFPPPLVQQQQQMSSHHHQTLLNSPAFMPTSVMRQMSKMPGCGSSVNSGGESPVGGLNSNNTSALLQKMFAEPFVFNPALGGGGGPYGGGGNPFPGGGYGGHHFQNMGPSHGGNFALPPYAMPFTPSHQQFYPPFGSSTGMPPTGLNHPTYPNRQQSPCNNSMNFPPPLVNPQHQQQQMSSHHHQNLLNSPAFMPTSVMRQMSKMPGCGSSVNSGGGDSTCGETINNAASGLNSNNTSALLQKMFAEAKRSESQQQQPQSTTGRAILGRDPTLEIGILPTEAQESNPS